MPIADEEGQKPGAGLVTFRWLLGIVSGLTLTLLSFVGSRLLDSQAQMEKDQGRMATSMATLAQKMTDTSTQVTSNTLRLDDHEHRITILEVRSSGH